MSELTAALLALAGRSVCVSGCSVALQLFGGWLDSKVLLPSRLSLFPLWVGCVSGSRSSGPGGGGNLFRTASTTLVSLCPPVTDTGRDGNVVAKRTFRRLSSATCAGGSCAVSGGSGGPAMEGVLSVFMLWRLLWGVRRRVTPRQPCKAMFSLC